MDAAAVDLSHRDFWVRPPAERHAVFDLLRRDQPFAFFAEPEVRLIEPGPGVAALLRPLEQADVDDVRDAVAACPTRARALAD